ERAAAALVASLKSLTENYDDTRLDPALCPVYRLRERRLRALADNRFRQSRQKSIQALARAQEGSQC
ncbi:MAG TPA: hypothetical protein VGJ21_11600, partial [Terracidiphilus sp.]